VLVRFTVSSSGMLGGFVLFTASGSSGMSGGLVRRISSGGTSPTVAPSDLDSTGESGKSGGGNLEDSLESEVPRPTEGVGELRTD
jgi:hypothetical protein